MAAPQIDVELWNLRVPLVPPIKTPRGAVTERVCGGCVAKLVNGDGNREPDQDSERLGQVRHDFFLPAPSGGCALS